jgi:hypothetical protein
MTERRNADLFEVLIGQIRQNDKGNVVLGKAVSVLPETKLMKPIRNLLHLRPHGFNFRLDRYDRKPTTSANLLQRPQERLHVRVGSFATELAGRQAGRVPLCPVCGRLRVGKNFFHACRIGRCARVFGLSARLT